MIENLETLIKAKKLELEGINMLLEAITIMEELPSIPKMATSFKSYMDRPESNVFESQLNLIDKPFTLERLDKDIHDLKEDTSSDHNGVIKYLERFKALLKKMPNKKEDVIKFIHDIGVPLGNENLLNRVSYMLDHVMDVYTDSRDKEKVSEWSEGKEYPRYADRVQKVVEFMTKEQHRFA